MQWYPIVLQEKLLRIDLRFQLQGIHDGPLGRVANKPWISTKRDPRTQAKMKGSFLRMVPRSNKGSLESTLRGKKDWIPTWLDTKGFSSYRIIEYLYHNVKKNLPEHHNLTFLNFTTYSIHLCAYLYIYICVFSTHPKQTIITSRVSFPKKLFPGLEGRRQFWMMMTRHIHFWLMHRHGFLQIILHIIGSSGVHLHLSEKKSKDFLENTLGIFVPVKNWKIHTAPVIGC